MRPVRDAFLNSTTWVVCHIVLEARMTYKRVPAATVPNCKLPLLSGAGLCIWGVTAISVDTTVHATWNVQNEGLDIGGLHAHTRIEIPGSCSISGRGSLTSALTSLNPKALAS